jgi:RND superfamily putative drug exporter
VALALAALIIFPQRFLYSTAIGGLLVVLLSAAVALTVLPAILAVLGPRVNALAPPRLQRGAGEAAGAAGRGFWYRLASFVLRRPITVLTATVAVMLAAGIPFLSVHLSTADARVLPLSSSARQVDEALRSSFPDAASATPLVAVINARPDRPSRARLAPVVAQLSALPYVKHVLGPRRLDAHTSQLEVVAGVDPLSEDGQRLLREVRGLDWPYPTLVGGRAADLLDQKQSLQSHLPLAVGIIVVMTLITLFAMTGSALLPLAALLMNGLTISAAFGIVVLVFQDGRFQGLLSYTSQGAIDTSMPVLVFAVAFGLSTDYGVFLLTRIKEARDSGASDTEAVAIGIEHTGRIVTAAALLFAVAVGAFMAAVLVDATLVRAFLLPSLMRLLGRWSWWAPAPLLRLRERLSPHR